MKFTEAMRLEDLSDDDLAALLNQCIIERDRRESIAVAKAKAAALARECLEALGRLAVRTHDGEVPAEVPEWVKPAGVHDAYPAGALVSHNDALWECTNGGNLLAPSKRNGWKQVQRSAAKPDQKEVEEYVENTP